jgi:hypothetical protein
MEDDRISEFRADRETILAAKPTKKPTKPKRKP